MSTNALENYRLSMKEKTGYAMGDLACNLIYTTVCS